MLHSLDVRENSSWQILSETLAFIKVQFRIKGIIYYFLRHCVFPLLFSRTLQKFVNDNRENLKMNLPKIFLQFVRVIESARWNIITFSPERLKACEEGIDVLELIRDLFPVAECE